VLRRILALGLLLATCAFLPSCGGDGGTDPADVTPPTIVAIDPPDGATDVDLVQRIEITFSEPMDATTLSETTLIVAGRAPRGHVTYDPITRTATVIPDTLYAAEAWHEFVVTDGVEDAAGNPLAEPDTSTFRTDEFGCLGLEDCFEPNGNWEEPAQVALDVVERTLAICGTDEDFYTFTTDTTAMISVVTSFRHADAVDWLTAFMRPDGEGIATSSSTVHTGDEKIFYYSFLPGTYLVRLATPWDDDDFVLYDLELRSSSPCRDDAYEDNDIREEAAPVEPGTLTDLRGCYLDEDWYAFEASVGETLRVTLINEPVVGSQSRVFGLSDPAGSVAWSNATDDSITIGGVSTQTGIHYVSLQFWTDDVDYELTIEVSD